MASPTQFEDASISKLMAGALLMDGECSDPFPWEDTSNSATSPVSAKLDRTDHLPPNVDGWQLHTPSADMQRQIHNPSTDISHPYQPYMPQNNRFDHLTNGNINNGCSQINCDGLYKSPQDQIRQKYGNYSNEKYPDYNIALKAETAELKWSPCAVTSTAAIEYFEKMSGVNCQASPLEESYSPKSFTSKETTSDESTSPCIGSAKKSNFVKSEPDSKTNGHDEKWQDCNESVPGVGSIDIDHMINSGVTVAGYKPRKIICKRKKSTVPTDLKDSGYWEKRKKNNDSARRSREAKKEKERNFYKRALHLEYENHYLKERVAYLETKLNALTQQHPNHFSCNETQPVI